MTHSALVWLLSCVSAHMNHQHVLGFERPLLSRALLPVAHKLLLLSVDVLVVDVLQSKQTNSQTMSVIAVCDNVLMPLLKSAQSVVSSIGQYSISHMNKLVLCVKLLVAAFPATVSFVDSLWLRFPILFVQVISAIQQTQERVLMHTHNC